jgi:hypothetical protein
MNYILNTATEAVILLKNGNRKYGVIEIENYISSTFYRFVSNTNLNLFKSTNNPAFIENIDEASIVSIDIDLK